jgi:hypothetical protein
VCHRPHDEADAQHESEQRGDVHGAGDATMKGGARRRRGRVSKGRTALYRRDSRTSERAQAGSERNDGGRKILPAASMSPR